MRDALARLTALPLPRSEGPARATVLAAYPVVGILVGLVWVATARVSVLALGPAVAAAAVLLVDAWLTRALHLDGLASVVDGVAGGEDPEDAVALAREAAIAVPGAAALLTVSLVRFAILIIAASPTGPLLAGLVPAAALVLVTAPTAGRLAMVACHALVPARDDEDDVVPAPTPGVLLAAGGVALLAALPAGVRGVVALVAALAVAVVMGRWWQRRLGGLVAELPAAVALVAETVALVVLYAGS